MSLTLEASHHTATRPPRVGDPSPWDTIDHTSVLIPGVVQVQTPGHGGLWLSDERIAQLPAWARLTRSGYCPKPRWWEEDCEAVIPMLAFYDEFKAQRPSLREPDDLLACLMGYENVVAAYRAAHP